MHRSTQVVNIKLTESKNTVKQNNFYIRLISNCLSLTKLLTPICYRTYTKVTFSARHYSSMPD